MRPICGTTFSPVVVWRFFDRTLRRRERDSNPRSPVSEGSGLVDNMIVDFDLDKLRSTDPPRG